MSALIAFLVLMSTAAVLATLLDVYADDPPRDAHHTPPRSHPTDEFSRTGSSWH